jgi:cephalosporin-C deacetylase-like acetyl esterase
MLRFLPLAIALLDTSFPIVVRAVYADEPVEKALPGTKLLEMEGDIAAQMVAGIDKFLMRELAASAKRRQAVWKPDRSSPEAYEKSVAAHRERLRKIIGAVDPRRPVTGLEYSSSTAAPALVAKGDGYSVFGVRWPVFEGVEGEGLLLQPDKPPVARIVALPDADQTPEQVVGLAAGVEEGYQWARGLAENGCQVVIATLIDRSDTLSGNPRIRFTNQPHREFVYRAAYEMGRHIIGYEVQKVLAVVDWFEQESKRQAGQGVAGQALPYSAKIGVFGYGEGGVIALFAAALDTRIDAVVVSGYFQPRESVWQQPIYRNVWSQLTEFGDAELLSMVAPRAAIVENSVHPSIDGPPKPRDGRSGAAPGVLTTPPVEAVRAELDRARNRMGGPEISGKLQFIEGFVEKGKTMPDLPGSPAAIHALLHSLGARGKIKPVGPAKFTDRQPGIDATARLKRQFDQLNEHTQRIVRESEFIREKLFSKADMSSVEKYVETSKPLRDLLWEEVIGKLPPASLPASPRTRLAYDTPKWRGYEVVLDVYPDVFAYGVLLVPKDLEPGERRPVVVCQHGLEGRPRDTIQTDVDGFKYYKAFSAKLADRGFVVYAPQNPYIGQDNFRVLQRKANPLKLSLFSFIIRQHERTLEWLASLPYVDPARIGFYGLSYGGKTAVRVPTILADQYALSICSADYNEWIWKNTSLSHRYSYVYTGEYEMFEFDLGNTFNYAELSYLMVPRPFMVERGHRDGVAPTEWVAYEYSKVRRLYDFLGIGERTEIEFFPGPHEINGVGTFEFLHRHLKWPASKN